MKTRPFIKICGITRPLDMELVIKHGVDAIGFIAYPKSPRYISPDQVKSLIQQINSADVLKVGVFVNSSIDEINEYLEAGVNVVQLHGDETPEFAESINAEVWRAIRLKDQKQIDEFRDFPCQKFLIDSFVKDSVIPGGTGHVANWELARKFVDTVNTDVLLAGGISSENLNEALKQVKPLGLDLSSSVEQSPGIKDQEKVKNLFRELDSLVL